MRKVLRRPVEPAQFTGPTVMDFGKTMEAISIKLEHCPLPYRETIAFEDRTAKIIAELAPIHLIDSKHVGVETDPDPDNDIYFSAKPFRVRPKLSLAQGGLASPSPFPKAA
jgi:hypothetical protein